MNYGIGMTKSQNCLKKIKEKFIEELILKIYQPELPIKVKIDVLDFILGTCLLQKYSEV